MWIIIEEDEQEEEEEEENKGPQSKDKSINMEERIADLNKQFTAIIYESISRYAQ